MYRIVIRARDGTETLAHFDGVPRYIHCYDNGGETLDRYTVVFTGRYTHKTDRQHWYVRMSAHPSHPQGFGQHGESAQPIDYPRYSQLGRKIKFADLPPDCQRLIHGDYLYLWDLPGAHE